MKTAFTLNGRSVSWDVEVGESLRDALRRKGVVGRCADTLAAELRKTGCAR